MGRYATISVKIPAELKEELRRRGIKVADVVREALRRAVAEARMRELEGKLEEIAPILEGMPLDFVVRSIREDRDRR
ncbi:CopG family transcriptional regulator [Candidatus Bathyarchaeota archaeon]|nr:MAG: CopG family transcriptional regulator [Candidatus Bathyarchaeota archaeon]